MPVLLPEELNIKVPKLVPVKQIFDKTYIEDVEEAVRKEVSRKEISLQICEGQRIAIAVGSRGINRIDIIIKTLVDEIKKCKAVPFIVSAMGSHGGGTEEGQLEVLTGYGITEERMGVPVITSVDVVEIGQTKDGYKVYTDKTAYEADGTILVNRVKQHTDFEGSIESGLCKMSVIGLGNHIGCASIHTAGFDGFSKTIEEAARIVLEKSTIIFGMAIVENALEQTFHIEAVLPENIVEKDKELLRLATKKMPKLQFEHIDVLVVEEIGKNISGNGADPNIVGRHGPKANSKDVPRIDRMIVLDLSEETHGNAIGIGMADFTTKAVLNKMNFETTYANCLASRDLLSGRLPFVMEDEREAVAAALKLYSGKSIQDCKIVRIKSTMELEHILVSESLMPDVKAKPDLFEI